MSTSTARLSIDSPKNAFRSPGVAQPGDYVISHAGYAIQRIDEVAAQESLTLLKEILDHEAP